MKKYILLIAFCFATSLSFSQNTETTYNQYFDHMIEGVGFEMPLADFKALLDESGFSYQVSKSGKTFFVNYTDREYNRVIYSFSSNVGEILTEIQMEFSSEDAALNFLKSNFGKPKRSGGTMDWQTWDEKSPYFAKAWQFTHKIFFVAGMEGTRWDNIGYPKVK